MNLKSLNLTLTTLKNTEKIKNNYIINNYKTKNKII